LKICPQPRFRSPWPLQNLFAFRLGHFFKQIVLSTDRSLGIFLFPSAGQRLFDREVFLDSMTHVKDDSGLFSLANFVFSNRRLLVFFAIFIGIL